MTDDVGDKEDRVFRRQVFYIPGYDPFHPRRYRELYRTEGAAQAKISGYDLTQRPDAAKGPFGWQVTGRIGGTETLANVEVLMWADLVKTSMKRGIFETYLLMLRTAWAYIGSGALFGLMRLRKGPMIAALYPILFLVLQLGFALLAGWGWGLVVAQIHWVPGVLAGAAMIWALLVAFRRWDNKVFAYYLMYDYAYSAQADGANPPELEARMAVFRARIGQAMVEDNDEVLVIGHSSGAHLAVSILSDLIREQIAPGGARLGVSDARTSGADGVVPANGHALARRSGLPLHTDRADMGRCHRARRWLRFCAL